MLGNNRGEYMDHEVKQFLFLLLLPIKHRVALRCLVKVDDIIEYFTLS